MDTKDDFTAFLEMVKEETTKDSELEKKLNLFAKAVPSKVEEIKTEVKVEAKTEVKSEILEEDTVNSKEVKEETTNESKKEPEDLTKEKVPDPLLDEFFSEVINKKIHLNST